MKKTIAILYALGICSSALAKTEIISFRAMTKAETKQNQEHEQEGYDWFVFPTSKGSMEIYWANPAFDVFSEAYTSKRCVKATNLTKKGEETNKTEYTVVKCPKIRSFK